MKTARFLLACVAASLLAACSADGITAPATPSRPAFDGIVAPAGDEGGIYIDTGLGGTANCILVVVVNPDGSTTTVCQATAASGQLGTGS
ncbi:MAG TPA: hypothetical protein VGO40_01170 [Longimicrobium sp.]|jgi:hypothetical protein|nr:hypothetical protein [Longimicrobium sp.]